MKLLFPGSFDPPTLGHEDIIKRAAALSDKLYVGVLVNVNKKYKYTLEKRIAMLERIAASYDNVEVISFDGLLVDAVKKVGADALVKGLRNSADYAYECDMAQINFAIAGVETFFLQSDPARSVISSSVVRELQNFNGDIKGFVPECILDLL